MGVIAESGPPLRDMHELSVAPLSDVPELSVTPLSDVPERLGPPLRGVPEGRGVFHASGPLHGSERRFAKHPPPLRGTPLKGGPLGAILICLICAGALAQSTAPASGAWPNVGADAAQSKYSPLNQITPHNVHNLTTAWTWQSIDAAIQSESDDPAVARATYFQCTPLYVDGMLYVTTCLGQAAALDPGTGETIWTHNPESWRLGRPPNLGYVQRGCAYWVDGVDTRIYYAAGDSYLHCLDANTGEPVATFGENGRADLIADLPRARRGRVVGHPSAPIVVGDVVIVGSSLTDGPQVKEGAPGEVRAYDARTGELRWRFRCIPQNDELGAETWEGGANNYSGGANAWAGLAADVERGLVYIPTGTPTNDFYGGHRLGDNLYGEALICLNAKTGERVWHFQTVHHGLWDYDNPSPPNVVDLTVDGAQIPAVAQVTKQGFTFVFNRVTGEPVFPIEERAVPQSTVPGERTSPTQPFPTKPPPFTRQGITEDDLVDFTPELREAARKILDHYVVGPLYTPPAEDRPGLMMPGYGGGANWPGAAFDPETGVLYVPSMNHPSLIMVSKANPAQSNFRYTKKWPEEPEPEGSWGWQEGPEGLPLFKPPYASITALDLNRGDLVWQVANGGRGPIDHPAIKHLNLDNLGTNARAACIVTKTLLIVTEGSGRSASATGGGNGLRFLDKTTGAELHRVELPDQATGVPMTYRHNGRQYIAVAVGSTPAQLVALALPQTSKD